MHFAFCISSFAADIDEFKVKREQVFEFTEAPTVRQEGDRVEIRFASKGYCDATVAVEDAKGRIVRHLASGVLGPNAPAPFARNSLRQTVVWDGKDDHGRYLDNKGEHVVRVSLGLKPAFERTLFWSPYKPASTINLPIIQATGQGVLVYEGRVVDSLRLYDHRGDYVRTVYPFPADKLSRVAGLNWHTFPQDGARLPLKTWFRQATLLTSGDNSGVNRRGVPYGVQRFSHDGHGIDVGNHAASAMAVRDGRIALAMLRLNRLAIDGSTGGMDLGGPRTTFPAIRGGRRWYGGEDKIEVSSTSAALSPDGQWLYLAGYRWLANYGTGGRKYTWLNGVARMKFQGDQPAECFIGSFKQGEAGAGDRQFTMPTSVACDRQGRVYVSDYMNDRIQVFTPDGKLFKSIPAGKPARVLVHQRTGDIYVFSWLIDNWHLQARRAERRGGVRQASEVRIPARLTRLGPVEDPRPIASYPVALNEYRQQPSRGGHGVGYGYEAAIDSWTDPPTVWLYPGPLRTSRYWQCAGVQLLAPEGDRLVVKRDFGREAARAVGKSTPPRGNKQRLYVNPAGGKVYVADGSADRGVSFSLVVEADPASGGARLVTLPFDAEDMAFDMKGAAYLRAKQAVVRYDPKTWREIPWDYGDEHRNVNWASTRNKGPGLRRADKVLSGLPIPCWRGNVQSGMMISPKGHIVVGIRRSGVGAGERAADVGLMDRREEDASTLYRNKSYEFRLYPGRSIAGLLMVFDEHGRELYDDALPGVAWANGVGIDKDDNLYVVAEATRRLDGEPYFNPATNTLIKLKPKRARLISSSKKGAVPVPLADEARPKRPADLFGGSGTRLGHEVWAEGAEWFYGGVGYNGRHGKNPDFGCDCWPSGFALDYFARSFAPEIGHHSVAVLDSNGNLILRVGRYGNVDDGVPLISEKGVRSISIGGDEVGLFYAPFLATHTDRRLFIADIGNFRVLSVRLGYHAGAKVPLRDTGSQDR